MDDRPAALMRAPRRAVGFPGGARPRPEPTVRTGWRGRAIPALSAPPATAV